MKHTSPITLFAVIAIALSSVVGPFVFGTDDGQMDPATMAAYMEMAKPGPEHDRLAALEGQWTQTVRIWMEPGAEPMEFAGTSDNRMILEGRFLECHGVSGDGPMRTETLHIVGFDRRMEHYTVTGYDTWGTYSVFARGPFHADLDRAIMSGTDYDPILDQQQEYEMHLRFIDDDSYGWEVVFTDSAHTGGGEPFRMVEVIYSRVK